MIELFANLLLPLEAIEEERITLFIYVSPVSGDITLIATWAQKPRGSFRWSGFNTAEHEDWSLQESRLDKDYLLQPIS
jgi:hypothetical protein